MVYLFLADGFEEIEALTPVDVFRRAGIEVKTVSITDTLTVTGAHGIRVEADLRWQDTDEDAEMLVLPGGAAGTENLAAFAPLGERLKRAAADGKYVAAICAAPTVLSRLGLLQGKKATCYPALAEKLMADGAKYRNEPVVCDGKFITSEGAGTASDFAFALVDKLSCRKESDRVRLSMLY